MSEQIFLPINYYSARSLMRLFDQCYKLGVKDAIEVSDESICNEFCEKMYGPEKFGRLTNQHDYSWREWRFRLTQFFWAPENQIPHHKMGLKFFDCIGVYRGYIACALPVAMDFYLWGIKDYCGNPIPSNVYEFENRPFNLWGKKIKKSNMEFFVRKVIEFCYDREKIDAVAIEYKESVIAERRERVKASLKPQDRKCFYLPNGLSISSYRNFQSEIWRHTRVKEYKTREK